MLFFVNCNCIPFFASFILALPLICCRKAWTNFSLANQLYTMFTASFLLASKGNTIFSNPFLCQNFVCLSVIYGAMEHQVHVSFFQPQGSHCIEWQNQAGCIEQMWTDVANVLKAGLSHWEPCGGKLAGCFSELLSSFCVLFVSIFCSQHKKP